MYRDSCRHDDAGRLYEDMYMTWEKNLKTVYLAKHAGEGYNIADGRECGPWTGSFGSRHSVTAGHNGDYNSECHTGKYGSGRIVIGEGLRLDTWSSTFGNESVTIASNWFDFIHQRPRARIYPCDHSSWPRESCPYCHTSDITLE